MVTSWSPQARIELQKAYNYIKNYSIQNAEKVKDSIIRYCDSLPEHPERYPTDKYKQDNNGEYRAFEIFH